MSFDGWTTFEVLKVTASPLIFGLSVWLLDFIFEIRKNISIQKYYNQRSWIFYLRRVIRLAWCLVILVLFFLLEEPTNILLAVLFLGCWVAFERMYTKIIRVNFKKDLLPLRFASGSVGENNDQLGFTEAAKKVAQQLFQLKDHVNVVAIYGKFGFGKSSYTRMIIENLPQERTLYTYISLTETNEAKDFSKLFAERWFATLKERYPKIDTTFAIPFMQSIMRESGNGIITSLFSFIPALSKGLRATKAKVCDPQYKDPLPEGSTTSSEIANVFGNVEEIHEDVWVVMVDEIERARLDEIYRVVEVIERFKNEGRTGLPVKVIFMLCIADTKLREHLREHKTNELASLIEGFFFTGPKNLTLLLPLPAISEEKKINYIRNQITSFNDSLSDEQKIPDLEKHLEGLYFDVSKYDISSFYNANDERKRLSRVAGWIEHDPRLVQRVVQGLRFTFGLYEQEKDIKRPPVRFSDLLMMEYIKIKYPYIVAFFEAYADAMRSIFNSDDRMSSLSYTLLMHHFRRDNYKEQKLRIADLITEVSGETFPHETAKSEVEKIISFVSPWFARYFDGSDSITVQEKIEYQGTFGDPNRLYEYFSKTSFARSPYERWIEVYQSHKRQALNLKKMDLRDLYDYVRFIDDIPHEDAGVYLDVAGEIARRLISREISVEPKNVGDTDYDNMTLRLTVALLTVIELAKQNVGSGTYSSSELMDKVFDELERILAAPRVPIGAKFMILNSFANNIRGGGSSIHERLNAAFAYMMEYNEAKVRELIKTVFDTYDKKYFKGKSIIYKNEENFFFVMYQGWSGKIENTIEVDKIRKVAARGLRQHPDAIDLYWGAYPMKEGMQSYRQVLSSFGPAEARQNPLFMPLANLVRITKNSGQASSDAKAKAAFWEGAIRDSKYQKLEQNVFKDDNQTLRAVLVSRGLLNRGE